MQISRPLCRLFVILLAVACGVAAASAAPSLRDAVKKLDAKYLDVPQIDTNDESPKIEAGDWEEEAPSPDDTEIKEGAIRVTLTYREATDEDYEIEDDETDEDDEDVAEDDGDEAEDAAEEIAESDVDDGGEADADGDTDGESDDATDDASADEAIEDADASDSDTEDEGLEEQTSLVPIVTIYEDDVEVAKLEGDPGSADPPVGVQIAQLDASNDTPEVVVSFYTGGAHCCSNTQVLTKSADGSGWHSIEVGSFDGGPLTAIDLDDNGVYEFETRDNSFLYAFGCYACTSAPLEVLAIEDGAVKNVSDDPHFRRAHEVWLKDMLASAPEEDVNGFLAGYVGQKIRLGEGKQAWELMLDYYDRKSDWGLEVCEQGVNEIGECPEETVVLSFPDALERMLNKNGYKVEK